MNVAVHKNTWELQQKIRKVVSELTIKEVSETYDISADTLRYYERIGMIPEVTRTAGGIRDYQESDLGWVELVITFFEKILTWSKLQVL